MSIFLDECFDKKESLRRIALCAAPAGGGATVGLRPQRPVPDEGGVPCPGVGAPRGLCRRRKSFYGTNSKYNEDENDEHVNHSGEHRHFPDPLIPEIPFLIPPTDEN